MGVLVLVYRMSLLTLCCCCVFGVAYLFWQTQTIQVFPDAFHQTPPRDLRDMETVSAATRYQTGLYYVGLDVSPNPYAVCAVTQQL